MDWGKYMNLSFVVKSLGNSELSFDLISTINKHPEHSNSIFYQNILPPVLEPLCLTTNITSLNSANGICVCFDLDCANIIRSSGLPTRNVLYLYNLEWFQTPVNYIAARSLLDQFEVYAPNEKYAESLSNYMDKKITAIESIESLYKWLTTN